MSTVPDSVGTPYVVFDEAVNSDWQLVLPSLGVPVSGVSLTNTTAHNGVWSIEV
jgi:hypothetical protein